MFEITANIHIHTLYSDGRKYHADIAHDAIRAGVDVIFFSDHNIFIDGLEGYFNDQVGKVLMLMGEEIHDQNVSQQKNHLIALGAGKSFASLAFDRQTMIKKIHSTGGITFLAHPYDPALPAFNENNISWEDWSIKGYTGIELWNGFSELKVRVKKKLAAYFYAFFPKLLPLSPPKETLSIWNSLLNKGEKTVAVGGSDAHAIHFSAGLLTRVVFPYKYHFSTINNHILLENRLTGNFKDDKSSILDALRKGRLFIANDLKFSSNGFRFFAKDGTSQIEMGESHQIKKNMHVSVILPNKADCRILRNGIKFHQVSGKKEITVKIDTPGIYRVECYKYFYGRKRGWIFSNPIYIE